MSLLYEESSLQPTQIVFDDPCEEEAVPETGIVYRFSRGLTREQYGVRPGMQSNSMFIDTVAAGKWNTYGLYGCDGEEALRYGTSFHDVLMKYQGYSDVWLDFLWRVFKTPANPEMAPIIPVFQIGSVRANFYGWDFRIYTHQAPSEGYETNDVRLLVMSGIRPPAPVVDLNLGRKPFGTPHRVTFRIKYGADPREGVLLKTVHLDDQIVAEPNVQTLGIRDPFFPIVYNMGAGRRWDNPEDWRADLPTYAGWYVDNIRVEVGPSLYEYPWRQAVPPTKLCLAQKVGVGLGLAAAALAPLGYTAWKSRKKGGY